MARSRRPDDDDDDDTPRRKKSRHRDDDDDDDDEEDDTPRRKKSRSIADDDEDRPRKKSRSRDDDDDEDDDDDRPRKKRKTLKRTKKSAGGGPLLLILGLVGGFILLAGGGLALWFFVFNDTPEKAFAEVKHATLKKDYGRIYDRLDKQGQAEFENMKPNPFLKATQSGKKGRELYIEMRKEIEGMAVAIGAGNQLAEQERQYRESKVEKVTVDGDNATLTARTPDGTTIIMSMVKQDGRWRTRTGPGAIRTTK
jgi:hypothetical protein